MTEGSEKPQSRVLHLGTPDELKEKVDLRARIDVGIRALSVAARGEGKILAPDAEQRKVLQNRVEILAQMRDEVLAFPVSKEGNELVASELQRVRIGCIPYLSDEQYEEIFGSDKL